MNVASKPTFSDINELLQQKQSCYAEAKIHSQTLDQLFGFNCDAVEKNLPQLDYNEHKQLWYGLDLQSLQTPYSEILEIIQLLQPAQDETWVDLGAGYGRMGLVMGLLFPEMKFKGFEFVQARVTEANRVLKKWGCAKATLSQADIAAPSFFIPDADLFFIYDFGSKQDVGSVLVKLAEKAKRRPVRVVARGRGIRNWIMQDHPWLAAVQPPAHYQHWSIFRS